MFQKGILQVMPFLFVTFYHGSGSRLASIREQQHIDVLHSGNLGSQYTNYFSDYSPHLNSEIESGDTSPLTVAFTVMTAVFKITFYVFVVEVLMQSW